MSPSVTDITLAQKAKKASIPVVRVLGAGGKPGRFTGRLALDNSPPFDSPRKNAESAKEKSGPAFSFAIFRVLSW
jgi:hypothetical protein